MRLDSRASNELRPVTIETQVNRYAEGSALIKFGHTHVLCNASVETNVPKWLQGQGQGWVSAEYGMLPRSTHERMNRNKTASSGRTQEISRLVARSLRAAVDLTKLGEKQINVDCDVLQADGGTRTAAITGGFVALAQALHYLREKNEFKEWPLAQPVAAISVGVVADECLLDLCYQEDSQAETDANFVMGQDNRFIEIQATAEDHSFSQEHLQKMMALATEACTQLQELQSDALKKVGVL